LSKKINIFAKKRKQLVQKDGYTFSHQVVIKKTSHFGNYDTESTAVEEQHKVKLPICDMHDAFCPHP
jgi:hypothetical protein